MNATKTMNAMLGVLVLGVSMSSAAAQAPATVKATFVMNRIDAGLTHVRAAKIVLDDGKKKSPGYVVLFSARPADGDLSAWHTAEPRERGSFIYLALETTGEVWSAELGHAARKDGTIGVVTELRKVSLAVKDGRISGQYRTNGEQAFFDDRYTVDLTFDAPLEGN
jgi:hypothetical protein